MGEIQRTESYGDFRYKQRVVVTAGLRKGQKFEFLCHARNTRTGAEWLECYGGRSGRQAIVNFPIEGFLR